MAKRQPDPPPIEPREFRSPEEIDAAVAKLRRRIEELGTLNIRAAMDYRNGADRVAQDNVREAIREVFGTNSPEFREHEYIRIWDGPEHMGMSDGEILQGKERGRAYVIGILKGLIVRLEEKKADLGGGVVRGAGHRLRPAQSAPPNTRCLAQSFC